MITSNAAVSIVARKISGTFANLSLIIYNKTVITVTVKGTLATHLVYFA